MSDDKEETKKKKLTFNTGKLTLGKKLDPSSLKKSFVSKSSSNVTVEVKKSSNSKLSLNKPAANSASGLSNSEFNKRLDIIRKASKKEAQEKTPDADSSLVGTLSDFAGAKNNDADDGNQADESFATMPDSGKESKHHHAGKKTQHFEKDDDPKVDETKNVPPKNKSQEPRKLKKSDIFHMLDSDDMPVRTRSLASIKRAKAKEKRKMEAQTPQEKVYREVIIPEVIEVSELASRMSERVADVTRELMKLGVIATANQGIDADTAELIVTSFGHSFKRVKESDVENILQDQEDDPKALKPRAPVVTVMGHVDHGKTSLLDALKSTDIVSSEAGGITQHIGAYKVSLANGKTISFIDTPGHEAFTEMRSRGAKVTDIVVLVVAADDGIKAQTVEAINHAKAAKVPIIVAINKIDKPDADVNRVKDELLQHELISEDLGGDTIVVPVSALQRKNLDTLEEAILLVAEMAEFKSNYDAAPSGSVIESKIDKNRGVVTTILVQRGKLKVGDLVVAGESYGKIRIMMNDKGVQVKEAGPSDPVEIIGLANPPLAGESFNVVDSDKKARDITEYRIRKAKDNKVSMAQKTSLEDMFLKAAGDGSLKELPIVIKADVQGSLEAIIASLSKLEHDEIKTKVLHSGVGGITESDIQLSNASNAIILGFNVRASVGAEKLIDKYGSDVRYYSIIYNLIDDIKAIMGGMLSPILREEYIGSVDIRQVFNISKSGKIAGSYVTKGVIKKGAGVRLLRDDVVIHEGKLKTLKRFKEEVKEVKENFECGIAFENYEDIKVGDKVEVYEIIEEKRSL